MEEKDEFSDILLERESENKASKFKKIVILIGILVLVFLIVLLIMKALNTSSNSSDSKLVLPEQNQKHAQNQQQKDDPLFEQVSIIQEDSKKESFEEMVKKLKERENKRIQEQKQEDEIAAKQVAQNEPQKVVQEVKIVEKKVQPVEIKQIKPVTKQAMPIKQKEPTKIKKVQKVAKGTPTGTYIQVLASTKLSPDKAYIAKIQQKNYPYELYQTSIKNTKYLKVLIGPYKNQSLAREALAKVKKDLNPNAFIFYVK